MNICTPDILKYWKVGSDVGEGVMTLDGFGLNIRINIGGLLGDTVGTYVLEDVIDKTSSTCNV